MSDLSEYAARLLLGTDLTPDTATATADGTRPGTSAAARALRDGWTAPDDCPEPQP